MTLTHLKKGICSSALFRASSPLSKKQSKLIDLFFAATVTATFISLLAALLYYVYAFAALSAGNRSFDWLLGIFSDFAYIMNVSLSESPYVAEDSSYPPFAIFALYPFALICKGVFAKYADQVLTVDELTSRLTLHGEFWIAISLFFAVCSIAIVTALTRLFGLAPKDALKIGVITLVCAPTAFAVMRGNTIYFALIFTVLFLILEKSRSAVIREIGYLFLVLAGLIKIYPLFFGVFLLCKKRIWASVRIALYSILLFLSSFLLFRGSADLLPFFKNLGGFASSDTRLTAPNNLSLASLLCKTANLLGRGFTETDAFRISVTAILLATFAISAVFAILTRSTFSRYVIVSSVIILIPPISYFYVLIFALLPFIQFIREYESFGVRKQRACTLAFLFLFLTPTMLPQNYIVHSLVAIAMLAAELISVANELQRKNANTRISTTKSL